MKKEHLRSLIMGGAITFILMTFLIVLIHQYVEERQKKEVMAAYEVGIKMADAKWLYREGKLTLEELNQIADVTRILTYEELEQLLDEFLEGKEDEYFLKETGPIPNSTQ